MRSPIRPLVLIGLLATLNTGCVMLGAEGLPITRADYNQAVQRSTDEQMLLNLVRLRFRDAPMFLDITSVSSQMSYSAGLSGSSSFSSGNKPSGGLGASLGYNEKPTISFAPLHGEKFTQQLLTQIPLDRIALLYHSGWSVERILRLCVQRINDLRNAPRASGPTPDTAPVFETFREAVAILRTLQLADQIDLRFDRKGQATLPVLYRKGSGEAALWNRFLTLTGSRPDAEGRIFLTQDSRMPRRGFLYVETRSFMGALHLLSHAVAVAPADEEQGRVTVTRNADGSRFDWNLVNGNLMRIHSAARPPADSAATSVRYRGRWYFIDDADLDTKSTFTLLHQLFSLQADKSNIPPPALTLSLGG